MWRLARFIYKRKPYKGKYVWIKDKKPELLLTISVFKLTRTPVAKKRKEYETNIWRRIPKTGFKEPLYVQQKHVELLAIWRKELRPITLTRWLLVKKGVPEHEIQESETMADEINVSQHFIHIEPSHITHFRQSLPRLMVL